jgi:hypothetical protein
MTSAIEFSGLVKDGRLPATVAEKFNDVLRRLDGKRFILTIREQKRRRSLNQNNYYFGVLVKRITEVFRDVGNDMDEVEVHEYLKDEVGKLTRIAVLPDGEVVKIRGSTKRLTTAEFENYLEKVRAWAATMGIALPLPNEIDNN